jgi:tRNA(Arg) A34 adenosine deaminase TadA
MSDHEKLMRRAIELSANARDPFGALLADPGGRVVMEAENTAIVDGTVTSHAETNLVRDASKRFSREELGKMTLYASCEPCAMCAGAIFFAGIRSVVYGLSGETLMPMWVTKSKVPAALLDLSCREVFAHCESYPTKVVGPMLEEEAAVPHQDFWPQRLGWVTCGRQANGGRGRVRI